MPLWSPAVPINLPPWRGLNSPNLVGPLPSGATSHPTSGLVGKRNLQPRSLVTGNTSCTYRLRYPVTVTASRIRMTFPAWSTVTAGIGDVPTGNPVTLGAVYAEYGGTLYPVTFGGQSSYTIDSGGAVTSDEVAGLTVAAGTTLYIRTYVTVSGGGQWPGLYGAFTYPDEVSRPGTNLANATGDLTGTGQSTTDLYGPLRVFGEIAAGQPFYAITVCGDSIAAGTNDDFTIEPNVGYYQRALWPGNRPFSIVALPGENGTMLLTQGANRADIVGEYADYVINQYGINDLQSGASLAQLQARTFANTVISRNPWVNGRLQQTLGPKTSSTDGWATTANQTPDAINADRVTFNDWVRDGMPEIGQVAVAAGTVGAIRAGQGGHPYTGYIEVADLCESARNSGLWKPGYTGDGLHPNALGNAAIAGALDLSQFVDTFPTTAAPTYSLVRDASSPAMTSSAFQGSSGTQAYASNTFSPPAGSVIVVAAQATQSFTDPWGTPTITDSLGSHLTWTLVTQQADVSFSGANTTAALFWASCPSAQTNMTVTVTQSCSGSGQSVTFSSIAVDVFTGADTAPIGTTAKGTVTANTLSVSLTPAGSASASCIMAANVNAASVASTAGSGEYLVNETHTGTSFVEAWYGNAAGPTIPSTAQTLDVVGATGARWQYIAYEVKGATVTASTPQARPQVLSTYRPPHLDRQKTGAQIVRAPADVAATDAAAAGAATGTGAATDATVAITTAPGVATGAGAANQAAVNLGAAADVAAGTGAAGAPTTTVSPSGGLAAGTGTAQAPTPLVGASAGNAAGVGTADDATATTVSASPRPPAVLVYTGRRAPAWDAPQQQFTISALGVGFVDASPTATSAAGTGSALQSTVNTSGNTSAVAGQATGTGTANNATITVAPPAGAATGTGTAQAPAPKIAASAGVATGTGTANQPNVSTTGATNAAAGNAAGVGTANQSAATAPNATAGNATGTGAAHNASIAVASAAGTAAGTGAANPATIRLVELIPAGVATGTGTAHNTTNGVVVVLYPVRAGVIVDLTDRDTAGTVTDVATRYHAGAPA